MLRLAVAAVLCATCANLGFAQNAKPRVHTDAADPFTGTWQENPAKSKYDPRQETQKQTLDKGVWTCWTCDPGWSVPADGSDHPVSGHPELDTVSVRIDGRRATMTYKKAGKASYQTTREVSSDGQHIHFDYTYYGATAAKTARGFYNLKRVGPAPAGDALSGEWVRDHDAPSEGDTGTYVFEATANFLRVTPPDGEWQEMTLDGKEVRSGEHESAVFERLDARNIVITEKRDGKVVRTQRLTVSPDGRTMTNVLETQQGKSIVVSDRR